ncbi:MAG: hypothetical protein ACREJP_05860 [Candidatus Methylomirabilales bacterium]
MELEGHPTQDLVEELERRGGMVYPGNETGPDPEHLTLARHRAEHEPGVWVYLPKEAYDTGFDEKIPF